jgi:hypothetical protein
LKRRPADRDGVVALVALVALVATGTACGPASEGADAGASVGDAFALELGTGRETFRPLVDGDTVFLERGFQGAQHVLASVHVALEEGRYLSDFALVRDDGVQLSEPSRARVPFAARDDGDGAQLTGYRVVVGDDDVEAAVLRQATLSVVVEDADGGSARDERSVFVAWAPEGWDPDAS